MGKNQANASELKIRVSGLSSGLHEYHFSVDPASIGLAEHFHRRIDVDARLDKTPRQLYLNSEIRVTGDFECDRCLDGFERALECQYSMFYVYDEEASRKYPEEEVRVITPDTVSIDLSDDVRQMVLFSVPLKLLCKEECKGLCPKCGMNWNRRSCECKPEPDGPSWKGFELINKK